MGKRTIWFLLALLCVQAAAHAQGTEATDEKTIIKKKIEDSIGWALTKDFGLLAGVIANDPDLFIFHPDSKSTVVGWEDFTELFKVWEDPRFTATHFEVKDLRINVSKSGDVAWYSCFLDDFGEWDGAKIGWENARWTGVLEKRGGNWVIVQMHFSFPSDRQEAEKEVENNQPSENARSS
jgi:ketosteroid isomerase-like protein